ncbi:hypothetical protein KM043_014708 [Ampulex compressa]|nr:hypothetical protein KM043_014708 [Ampulex compressa]
MHASKRSHPKKPGQTSKRANTGDTSTRLRSAAQGVAAGSPLAGPFPAADWPAPALPGGGPFGAPYRGVQGEEAGEKDGGGVARLEKDGRPV